MSFHLKGTHEVVTKGGGLILGLSSGLVLISGLMSSGFVVYFDTTVIR